MKYAMFLLLLPALLCAQEFQFQLETSTIPVEMEGWSPFSPWAGGESQSYPELFDIDGDGDLDFFIGNFLGWITYFDNAGNGVVPSYQFVTRQFAGVNLYGFTFGGSTCPEFCDIDADGDGDLFSGDFAGLIHFWENIGSAQNPEFELVTDTLAGIDADGFSKFNFGDLDADGDFDIVLGDYFGRLWYYENSGTAYAFNFTQSPIWISSIDVGQYASPALVDLDADGDYDLFIGERYGKLWYYRNDGDSANYNFTYVTNFYDSIDVGDYSSPEFADIDGDGDYDLFVGREPNAASLIGDVFFYENIGTPQEAQFRLIARDYLMLDVWKYEPKVQLVDMNGDDAMDLMLGVSGYLHYFVNTGDSSQAQFEFVEQGFQGIYQPSIQPYFVDIDADGDYDLLCGHNVLPNVPSVALHINHGTAQNPQLVLYSNDFITNPEFFVNVTPVLVDIDADADNDLFMLDGNNHFYYYQNNGTPQWPSFVLMTNQWQGIVRGGYFCFADLDGDSDLDLVFTGTAAENFFLYRNIGWPQNAQMVLADSTLLDSSYQYIYTPFLSDIDSDEDYDLFAGHANGGILFFRNVTGEPPGIPPMQKHPQAGFHLSLGPNPANPVTFITFSLPYPQEATLAVYNLLGAKVTTLTSGLQPPGEQSFLWDASRKASGVYVVRLEAAGEVRAGKIVVVK